MKIRARFINARICMWLFLGFGIGIFPAALPVLGQVRGQINEDPDLELTYSYWLESEKVADLTVSFSVLRVSETGLETIIVNQTYWMHGLPGSPTGRTEATAIAHHDLTGAVRTLAYTLDFRRLGGGQASVQRVGNRLHASGIALPYEVLPDELQERAARAMDPYSAAVATLFRVKEGSCPKAGDILLPEGLITLTVRRISATKCRVREQAVALIDGAAFSPA